VPSRPSLRLDRENAVQNLRVLVLVALCAILAGGTLPEQDAKPEAAASRPVASQPASAPATRTPEQAAILKELLRDVERPTLNPPRARRATADRVAAADGQPAIRDGEMLRGRSGRLLRSGERSEFQYVNDEGKTVTFELVPCAWLEFLEDESGGGAEEFIINAEVLSYRGRSLLLLRSVRRQVNNGNISP
jgi:hypothetical protein